MRNVAHHLSRTLPASELIWLVAVCLGHSEFDHLVAQCMAAKPQIGGGMTDVSMGPYDSVLNHFALETASGFVIAGRRFRPLGGWNHFSLTVWRTCRAFVAALDLAHDTLRDMIDFHRIIADRLRRGHKIKKSCQINPTGFFLKLTSYRPNLPATTGNFIRKKTASTSKCIKQLNSPQTATGPMTEEYLPALVTCA